MSTEKKSAWDVWKERLPKATVDRIDGAAAPAVVSDFAAFVSALPAKAQKAVSSVTDGPPPRPEETCKEEAKRFGCVECDNGEFPKMRLFKDAESLAKYLGSVEGQDKAVWCFHGVPMRFTTGPQRYLFMPDGETAMTVPIVPGAKIHRIEADLIGTELQEDGFVGPSYLANTDGLQVEAPPEPGANAALDDDELTKDDDEDGEEEEV